MPYFGRTPAIGLLTLTLAVGCSGGSTTLAPQPGVLANGTPTGAATGTPAPTGGPTGGGTATPTPAPTATATPVPVGSPSFSPLACSATTNTIPGYYTSFFTFGNVTNQTQYTGTGTYSVTNYTSPTPTPAPTATPTPGPTAAPTTTPTPRAYFIYSGTYLLPPFATNATTGAPSITTNTTNGCVFLLTTQDGTPLSSSASFNGLDSGTPSFATNANQTAYASGMVTASTINLTTTGGSGSITLDNGTTGTVTLTSRSASTFDRFKILMKGRL